MTLETLALQGHPGVHSSMAASITARIKEVRSTFIKECFCDFQHIEHRRNMLQMCMGLSLSMIQGQQISIRHGSHWKACRSL
jgi:UDP-N-acetylmuramoylalanine-D-glutamate ligase